MRQRLFAILPSTEFTIACGAVLGATARVVLGTLSRPVPAAGLPLGTLIVNLLGCLLIGVVQTLLLERTGMRRGLQLFVSVGFLGGLTTFSSVSVESVRLIQSGALLLFVIYQLLSLLGGALMVTLGMALAHRLGRLFGPQQRP